MKWKWTKDDLQAELDEAFFALDDDWLITDVNDRAAELVRLPAGRKELLGSNGPLHHPDVSDGAPTSPSARLGC